MKKITILLLLTFSLTGIAQSIQVQNMVNYLRNKEFEKAKAAADAAAENDQTKTSSKMWMYRGNVYKAIYTDTSKKVNEVDREAEEKALQAYVNCMKFDKDLIYKDEVKGDIVRTASGVKRKAEYYKINKQYENALKCYDLLETALPYDFDQGLKRNNITKDWIMFDKYEIYQRSGDKQKTKEFADKLIAMNYKNPKIYLDMVQMSLNDKDTAAALAYIEKGKIPFEDNMSLIGTEIDIYIAQKKTAQLKDKLNKAIEISPDNEVLHAVLGQVHEKTNDLPNAEKEYLKALEIKPDFESVNYKLGAMYFNAGNEYNKKINDLKPGEKAKEKEYEEKVKENFMKAIPYLEKAYELNQDKAYKQRLLNIYTRLGEPEKAKKYK